ncbi:unnamed protein product, partial [Didymodactylos carnosus]
FTIKYNMKQEKAYSVANGIVQEVLNGIRTVTAFNGQKKEQARYTKSLKNVPSIGIKKGFILGCCQAFSNISTGIVFMAALWYGPYLIRTESDKYSAGIFVGIFISCLNVTWCFNQIIPSLEKFADAVSSGSYVFRTIARISKINPFSEDGEKPASLIGNIELRNVHFTYPARPDLPILKGVNMKIPSGKIVAFVGYSGCGKSTVVSLIPRLYDADVGQILLDNHDIRTLNIEWLRSQIGYVGQEPVLFSGTIEDNIRLGKPDATTEEIVEAAKMANAHDFIMKLDDNYKTSAKGQLSGGQKQRVAIARALISKPRILLLDEATSALDNTSEKVVQDALDKTKGGRTTIIIAHRLSTIINADFIIVFDGGRVAEQGTHDQLITQKGLYYELTTQKEEEKAEEKDDNDTFVPNGIGVRMSSVSRMASSHLDDEEQQEVGDDQNPQEMSSTDGSKRKRWPTPFFFKLLKLNSSEKYYLLSGAITSLFFGAVEPVVGLVYSLVFGLLANPDGQKQEIQTRNLALGIVGVYIVAGVLQFISTVSFAKAGEELTMRMRLLSFAAILRREISWFDKDSNSVGSLVTRLATDTTALKSLTGVRIGVLLQSLGAVITALLLAFQSGWKLTLVVLLLTPLLILSGYLQGRTQSKAGHTKSAKSFAQEGGRYAVEAIQDVRTVATLNKEKYFIHKYEEAFNNDYL